MRICKVRFLYHLYFFKKLLCINHEELRFHCYDLSFFTDWLAVHSDILNDIISTINSMNTLLWALLFLRSENSQCAIYKKWQVKHEGKHWPPNSILNFLLNRTDCSYLICNKKFKNCLTYPIRILTESYELIYVWKLNYLQM